MDKILGVYCGNKTGQSLLVTEGKVEMAFRSDDKVEQRGYQLVFTLVSQASVSSSLPVTHGKFIKFTKFIPLKFPESYFQDENWNTRF